MLALPAHPGRVGQALLAVGLLIGAGLALAVWRRLRPALAESEAAVPVSVVVALVLASTVAAAPFVAWRIVEDTRSNSRLTRAEAERAGGESAHVDPQAVAALGNLIPRDDSYAVVASAAVGGEYTAFWEWAAYALMPRAQLMEPAQAQWILSWDRDPRRLGVRVGAVRKLVTDGGPAPHTYYLARVVR
jgi:hypothetical protein